MCRLLGFISPTPTTAGDLIGTDECRRWQSMGTVHDDGWGTAWIDTRAEAVARFRTPTEGADDPRLARALDTDVSEGRICHLRMATTGLADLEENTHPFLADGVAMAHNGSVHPIEQLHNSSASPRRTRWAERRIRRSSSPSFSGGCGRVSRCSDPWSGQCGCCGPVSITRARICFSSLSQR
ncbi:hypothetical protein F8227_06440 [Brevibacterium linens ATCC 9172]|nr:hypothetical protein F8227_06440 [Brevibacterium linens ATCC 9172]